jgi:hypothetical protein
LEEKEQCVTVREALDHQHWKVDTKTDVAVAVAVAVARGDDLDATDHAY